MPRNLDHPFARIRPPDVRRGIRCNSLIQQADSKPLGIVHEMFRLGGLAALWVPPSCPYLPDRANDKGKNHLFCLLPVQEIEMVRALDNKVEGLAPFGRDRNLAQVFRIQEVVDLLDPVRIGFAET